MTMSNNENEKLKLYTQICADTYGEDLSHNKNSLDSSWSKVFFVVNGVRSP